MKKIIALCIGCLMFLSVLCGCDISPKNGAETNEKERISQYIDKKAVINVEDVEFIFDDIYERVGDNNHLSFDIKIKNSTDLEKEIKIGKVLVVREKNSVSYDAGMSFFENYNFKLKSGLTESISFSAVIPTSYKEEKYYIDFTVNDTPIRIYLYETPDELRQKLSVSYYVDDVLVYTAYVFEGRSIEPYVWESQDGMYYCKKWVCMDEEGKYNDDGSLKEDIIFNGRKLSIVDFSTTESDKYTFAWGINDDKYIPSNGTLVIPETFLGKPVRLSGTMLLSLPDDIHTIYIGKIEEFPNAFFDYSSHCEVRDVYFTGTAEEWEQYGVSVPSYVILHYNSSFHQ